MTPEWEAMIRFATAEKDAENNRLRAELTRVDAQRGQYRSMLQGAEGAIARVRDTCDRDAYETRFGKYAVLVDDVQRALDVPNN